MNWLVRTLLRDRTVAPISRPTMAVICGWFGAGCSLVVGRSIGVDVNPALASTVPYQQLTLGLLLMVGSALMIASGFRWRRVSTSWGLELWGLPVLLSGWTLYTISVAFPPSWDNRDPAAFPIILGLCFMAACGIRLLDVIRVIRRQRRIVEALPPEVRE